MKFYFDESIFSQVNFKGEVIGSFLEVLMGKKVFRKKICKNSDTYYYIRGPKLFGAANLWPHSSARLPTPGPECSSQQRLWWWFFLDLDNKLPKMFDVKKVGLLKFLKFKFRIATNISRNFISIRLFFIYL